MKACGMSSRSMRGSHAMLYPTPGSLTAEVRMSNPDRGESLSRVLITVLLRQKS